MPGALFAFLAIGHQASTILGPGTSFNRIINNIQFSFKVINDNSVSLYDLSCLSSIHNFKEYAIPQNVTYESHTYIIKKIDSQSFIKTRLTNVVLPYTISELGDYAFAFSKRLQKLNMFNSSINRIPNYCFKSSKITEIILPYNTTEIGINAFGDSALQKMELNHTIALMGEYAFASSMYLEEVNFSQVKMRGIPPYCFSNCPVLKKVIFPKIEAILEYSFANCTNLTSLDFQVIKIRDIKKYAFYNCSSLTIFNTPKGTTRIDQYVFAHCYSLDTITFPSTINILGPHCFSHCYSLRNISLKETMISTLEVNLFEKCRSLSKIQMPQRITSILTKCFMESGLESIEIKGWSTVTIYNYAFYGCSRLRLVNLYKSSTEEIQHSTFLNCFNLEYVVFPPELKYIRKNAFANTALKELHFINILNIGDGAFSNIHTLEGVDFSNTRLIGIESYAFRGSSIKYVVFSPNISKISLEAFANTSILQIVFPSSIENIDRRAFIGCKLLESADLSRLLFTTISEELFRDCVNLRSVKLPPNLKMIHPRAFTHTGLLEIDMPPQTKQLFQEIFMDCYSLRKANLSLSDFSSIKKDTFRNCYNLSEVLFPPNLQSIQDSAFRNSGLISVKLPKSFIFYDKRTFMNCTKLKYYSMKGCSCMRIVDSCFENCTSLETVILDEHVKTIGKRSFAGCGLTGLILLPNITDIGEGAFEGCQRLKYADMSKCAVRILEVGVFANCSALSYVVFPAHLSLICAYACKNTNLTNLILPESVENMQPGAFMNCTSLGNAFTSSSQLKSIEVDSFNNCTHLENITIPGTVRRIYDRAFKNSGVRYIHFPRVLEFLGLEAFAGSGLTRADMHQTELTAISDYCFCNTSKLTLVILPMKLDSIDDYAFANSAITIVDVRSNATRLGAHSFENCTNMTNANLYDSSFQEVEEYAFFGCTRLHSVSLPNSLSIIGQHAFERSGIVDVELKNESKLIEECAFRNCRNLQNVFLGETKVRELPFQCFKGCTSLDTIHFPRNLHIIGRMAFFATGLDELQFPRLLHTVEIGAFANCPFLKEVDFGDSPIANISNDCFANCSKLVNVAWGRSVAKIGKRAFMGSAMRAVILPPTLQILGSGAFKNSTRLRWLDMADSHVSYISSRCFEDCPVLSLFKFGQRVEAVGSRCFAGCAFGQLTLPERILSLGSETFANCWNLTSIDLSRLYIDYINDSMFAGCANLTNITLPSSLKSINFDTFADCYKLRFMEYCGMSDIEARNIPDNITIIVPYRYLHETALGRKTVQGYVCGMVPARSPPPSETQWIPPPTEATSSNNGLHILRFLMVAIIITATINIMLYVKNHPKILFFGKKSDLL